MQRATPPSRPRDPSAGSTHDWLYDHPRFGTSLVEWRDKITATALIIATSPRARPPRRPPPPSAREQARRRAPNPRRHDAPPPPSAREQVSRRAPNPSRHHERPPRRTRASPPTSPAPSRPDAPLSTPSRSPKIRPRQVVDTLQSWPYTIDLSPQPGYDSRTRRDGSDRCGERTRRTARGRGASVPMKGTGTGTGATPPAGGSTRGVTRTLLA